MNVGTLEEFKKMARKESGNILDKWDYNQFQIKCMKCGSDKCAFINTLKANLSCPTCMYPDVYKYGAVVIKCISCGNAITIIKADEDIQTYNKDELDKIREKSKRIMKESGVRIEDKKH